MSEDTLRSNQPDASESSSLHVEQYPLLPLRDVVVLPHMVVPLFVGREKSIRALETAMERNQTVVLVAQKFPENDNPKAEDVYRIGCVSRIVQLLKLPDGTVKVLVEGKSRALLTKVMDDDNFMQAEVEVLADTDNDNAEVEALRRTVLAQFESYIKLNKKIPIEILNSLATIDDGSHLADTIIAHLPIKLEIKQEMLELRSVKTRLENVLRQLEVEIDILQVEKCIRGRVKSQKEKSQREYYLNEQVKAIQ